MVLHVADLRADISPIYGGRVEFAGGDIRGNMGQVTQNPIQGFLLRYFRVRLAAVMLNPVFHVLIYFSEENPATGGRGILELLD